MAAIGSQSPRGGRFKFRIAAINQIDRIRNKDAATAESGKRATSVIGYQRVKPLPERRLLLAPSVEAKGRATNRGVSRALYVSARESHLKLYNLTITEWDIIDAFQNHVCAICKRPNKSGNRLSTDHSHITGIIRGLLCQRCNRILGKIEDPRFWRENTVVLLRAAADFLERFPAVLALDREVYTYPGKFGTKEHRKWLKKNRGVSHAINGGSTDDHRSSQRTSKTHNKVSRLCTARRRC